MKISRKIARMAMGHDDYHIDHDPEIPCGEAEQIAEEETRSLVSMVGQTEQRIEFSKDLDYARRLLLRLEFASDADASKRAHKELMNILTELGERI